MEQKEQIEVQLDMLEKCLACKLEILQKIYAATREQEAILDTDPFLEETFAATLERKEGMITLLRKYDQGFEQIFDKIKEPVTAQKEKYRERIQKMQQLIAAVTDQGVKIQALEQQNKLKLDLYLNGRKQEIKKFHVSSRTVSNYYKTMSAARQGEAYFMDKKR